MIRLAVALVSYAALARLIVPHKGIQCELPWGFLSLRFHSDLSEGWEDAEMGTTVQSAAPPRHATRQLPIAAALTALGIVYGDIGTSPLYAFKQAAQAGGTLSPETILGVASLIRWTLILIISVKYALLIMRADNHGEGGVVALLALLDVRRAPQASGRASLLIVGLIGAALLYGDGVITPAISVLSAVEGLKVDAPGLARVVVPLSVAILMALFLVQRKGTAFIGNIFGPVMLLWFVVLGVLGIRSILVKPAILEALSPHPALLLFGPRAAGNFIRRARRGVPRGHRR